MSLTRLKSVGDGKRAESFGKFEVQNLLDLLTHYPRRWIDRTKEATIASAIEGADSLVIGEVKSVTAPPKGARRGPSRVTATIADESGRLSIVFFNQPWRERQLKVGSFVAVFGRLGSFNGTKQMANPTVDILGDPDERPRPIIAVYPQSEKIDLPSWLVLKAIDETLTRCRARGIHDPVSVAMRKKYKLMDRQSALMGIHVPETFAEKEMARRRLAFDELLRVQLVLVMRKRAIERDSVGIQHKTNGQLVSRFYQHLPYQLTGAQHRVIAEIESDLAGPHPMHRLLQGDVGAGKTIVAVAAMLTAVQGGHQGAIMAPTEVLAEQHAVGIRQLLQGLVIPDADSLFGEREVRVELLTSSVTAERRRDVLAGLADGRVDIAIGTHALIQETVVFHSLGVVVIDEQHRFGVEQRAALRAKGEGAGAVPDVLVMTATPIPRTAAMTVYGDLDVSVLDEKPPGRTPIVTRSAQGEDQVEEVWADVRAEAAAGRQVYVVCPLIEESEKLEVASAEETIERLAYGELRGLKLELLHGRMSSAEKEQVMNRFRSGETDVLVATTVIEVGVDVPNATIMVILDADRFGIAQLHQLRGRVGRGVHASRCWLVTTAKEADDQLIAESNPRIDALVESDDGFYLAEVDLELRGEGTLMNKEQKGRSDLKLASLRRDRELVELARDAAYEIVDADITLSKQPELRSELALFLKPEDEEFLFKN
ncbi:MAG: ATP-dependent DNA helicase RecG [Actinobacteria bacterium]|nr:ATP-dependent DNA helicase RecG [Actinomycetota bacterium]MTA00295.1 ATP-dependent DNA helicase RecG [Actinomycetota bacterium]MTA09489.1 ATP-dependent DNA helicase RecG [Actinomycetota bacterium]MTA69343.1 ATP-dependent DNA helicase RecG [Actinomycetota bacterium]